MKDMTEGRIVRPLLLFALPILLGICFQRLYNLFDSILVGGFIDLSALAAVGACGSVFTLFLSISHGFTNGFSIVIGQHYGAKDMVGLKKAIAGTYLYSIIISVLLSLFGLLYIDQILELIKVPPEIRDQAKSYLGILTAGIIFTVCYNMFSAVLRALGDSLVPLIFLIVSVFLNIVLDVIFILVLHWGVKGAALATVISQAVSAALCFIFSMITRPETRVRFSDFNIPSEITIELLSQGGAMSLMFAVVDIGSVILSAGINSLGPDLIAGWTSGRKYLELLMLPGGAFASSAATFVSQNYGAQNISRIKRGLKYLILISWIWATLATIIGWTFAYPLVNSITGKNGVPEVIEYGVRYLRVGVPFYYSLFVLVILRSSLQGINRKVLPLVASGIELVVKICATLLLIPIFGFTAVCYAEPVIWVLGMLWVAPAFYISIKKLEKTM